MNIYRGINKGACTIAVYGLIGWLSVGCTGPSAEEKEMPADSGGAVMQRQVTVSGAADSRLRVEAIDDSIARLWMKPSGEFERESSLATEMMPSSRISMSLVEGAGSQKISTSEMAIEVDAETLAFAVRPTDNGAAFIPATMITTQA
jgi:hypothetical protein